MLNLGSKSASAQAKSAVFAAIFSTSPLATFIRIIGALFVLAVVSLNFSHSLHTFAPLGLSSSVALASLFALAGIVGPVALHATLHAGSLGRGLVCIVTGLACVILCVATNLGATSAGRGNSTETARKLIDERDTLRDRKRFIVEDITKLGSPRAIGVIQAETDSGGGVHVSVLTQTKSCTDITKPSSQRACAPLAALRTELAAAQRLAELQPRLLDITDKLAKLDVPASTDAQADQIVWIASALGVPLSVDGVAHGTNALTAVLLELIAALTLSLATIIDDAELRRREAAERTARSPKIGVADEPVAALPVAQPVVMPALAAVPAAVTAPVAVRAVRLTPSQSSVLAVLRANGGRLSGTHRIIAGEVGIPASTFSAAVRHLCGRGAVRQLAGVVELLQVPLRAAA